MKTMMIFVIFCILLTCTNCTKTIHFRNDELGKKTEGVGTIVGFIRPSKITGFMHYMSIFIAFDEKGGVFDTSDYHLRGMTKDSIAVDLPVEDISYVQFQNTNGYKTYMSPGDVISFLHSFKFGHTDPSKDNVMFDKNGGNLDLSHNTIYGRTSTGIQVTDSLNNIYEVQVKYSSLIRTIRFTLSAAGLYLILNGISDIF